MGIIPNSETTTELTEENLKKEMVNHCARLVESNLYDAEKHEVVKQIDVYRRLCIVFGFDELGVLFRVLSSYVDSSKFDESRILISRLKTPARVV